MTRDEVLAWLHSRRPVPPETLRLRLDRAVEHRLPAPSAPLPTYLAEVGRALLDSVASKPAGGRELAARSPGGRRIRHLRLRGPG